MEILTDAMGSLICLLNPTTCMDAVICYNAERGDGEGAPIHMPMIRLGTVENHRMYCLMPFGKLPQMFMRTEVVGLLHAQL